MKTAGLTESERRRRESLYASLLPEIRRVAWDFGYAIGVHGTASRDLDLIAFPWIETAASSRLFVYSLAAALGVPPAYPYVLDDNGRKPLGREAWVVHLTGEFGGGPYLDIAIPARAAARS